MHAKRVVVTLAAAGLLLTGFDGVTYATTGHSLILGQVNKAGQTTTLENTGKGAALKLVTKGGAPPLAVSSTRRVPKLNSDLVDGWEGSALLNSATVLTDDDTVTTRGKVADWSLSDVHAGRYLVTWNVELAPLAAGTKASCGIVDAGYTQSWVSSLEEGEGASWSVPLDSSGVLMFDPDTMHFACVTTDTSLRLSTPLAVAFQPISVAQDLPLPELP